MIDLSGIGSALKGMFKLRPNNPSHQQMLDNLDELKKVSAAACAPREEGEDLDAVMRRIAKAMRP